MSAPGNKVAPPHLEPHVAALIRHKVRRLRAAGAISFHDGEDLAQELSLHAHVAAPKYDAARGARATFFEAVLARRLASLLSARSAQKRDRRRTRSLDLTPEREHRPTVHPPSNVAIDVRGMVAALPAELRLVAELFAKLTEAEVVRVSGLSRQQVRGRRRRIALHFERRGLR